jgi:hypothetical protein
VERYSYDVQFELSSLGQETRFDIRLAVVVQWEVKIEKVERKMLGEWLN